MGWIRRELANDLFWRRPDWQVDVESTEMREEIGLRYYLEAGDEHLAPEELGRRIDDCLVAYINTYLQILKQEVIGTEEFKSKMRKVEQGMREDEALRAFAVAIRGEAEAPTASETYLNLARPYALYGRKPPAYSEEGRLFARVLLDEVMPERMKEAKWDMDWDRRIHISGGAEHWLHNRHPYGLRTLIRDSEKSPVAWDTLKLICQSLAGRGEEKLPDELLRWSFDVAWGRRKRPDERPAPRHRPQTLGYKLRNNEIRHTVRLLAQVGIPKTAGCHAVAAAFNFSERTILEICRQPHWSIADLRDDARKRLEPSFHAYLHAPDAEARFLQSLLSEFAADRDSSSDVPPLLPLPPSQARFDPKLWKKDPLGWTYIAGGSKEEQLDALVRALSGKPEQKLLFTPLSRDMGRS